MSQPEMSISSSDRTILRDLARRVAEMASLPIMAERRALWKKHNALQPGRPMILIFPEGSWRELLTDKDLTCTGVEARKNEWKLRAGLYTHEHFDSDAVIEKEWIVGKAIKNSGWGLAPKWHHSDQATGARTFDPVIKEPADLKKITFPTITHDEAETKRNLAFYQDLFGDILDVKLKGIAHLSFHLMSQYTALRGLEEVMGDMIENPGWVHEAMGLLTEGNKRIVQQYEQLNLFSLNNDSTYHSSGGVGYSDELPAPGFDPQRVRPGDMWSSAETQEFALVSPAMHEEFALHYEKQLLAPFGLNGYGCCEDLTLKLDDVLKIPHIRRISISPFSNVDACAEKLGNKAIFSWKPHPAHLVGNFNPGPIRDYLTHTLDVTRGCTLEMILKDTHTCDGHPERFDEWSRIARRAVEERG